ncbi:KIF-binding protein [Episyrphus balteatus]|uniref:KIF-binding protein n=1 Tax=Episyrphus balteatus TaxID=286459 RepID=UPI0024857846|nr:KIF-binding protein [Episyrphus balteatus]
MVIPKETLTDFKEIYEKAVKLVNEESKNDPPTEPYRSHYTARDLLIGLKENLEKSISTEETNSENQFTYKVILAFVYRDLGRIYVFTEESPIGEKHLRICLESIEEHRMKPEAIISYVGALNELGIVHSNRQESKEAFEVLKKSEEAYNEFKASGKNAMTITDIFGTIEEVEEGKGPAELESLYTLCTFYMAQVYSHLGELEKSAEYCHQTLRRQLAAKTYEHIDFALNAATLSQYYLGVSMFREARHHLAAATMIMSQHETKMAAEEMNEEQKAAAVENFQHRYADVARCWAKYGLALLLASKERLYSDDEGKLAADVKKLKVSPDMYKFPDLNLGAFENCVSADYCLTFEDAKLIYHFVIKWLDVAKEYYTADKEATEYAKIITDYAELYQHMAFFEEDPTNQSRMHKRRATYFDDLLDLLNPTFYLSICRECWYGAGLAYSAMLDIKLDMIKAHSTPTPQEIHKINQICMKAIKHFESFERSHMNKEKTELLPNLTPDEALGVIYAYFYIGRLYYKLINPDRSQMLVNIRNSLKYYQMFIAECENREEAAKALKAEIGVCKEMVHLLPLKINSLCKELNVPV